MGNSAAKKVRFGDATVVDLSEGNSSGPRRSKMNEKVDKGRSFALNNDFWKWAPGPLTIKESEAT